MDLTNKLNTPTTIHWHGVHVPYNINKITWQKDPVEVGETFRYEFKLNQSGTYWYHPHFDTAQQVDRGLCPPVMQYQNENNTNKYRFG